MEYYLVILYKDEISVSYFVQRWNIIQLFCTKMEYYYYLIIFIAVEID